MSRGDESPIRPRADDVWLLGSWHKAFRGHIMYVIRWAPLTRHISIFSVSSFFFWHLDPNWAIHIFKLSIGYMWLEKSPVDELAGRSPTVASKIALKDISKFEFSRQEVRQLSLTSRASQRHWKVYLSTRQKFSPRDCIEWTSFNSNFPFWNQERFTTLVSPELQLSPIVYYRRIIVARAL
jgi:hypothetical protein